MDFCRVSCCNLGCFQEAGARTEIHNLVSVSPTGAGKMNQRHYIKKETANVPLSKQPDLIYCTETVPSVNSKHNISNDNKLNDDNYNDVIVITVNGVKH